MNTCPQCANPLPDGVTNCPVCAKIARSSRRQRAVPYLIILGLLGILAAILTPQIQQAREAARRSSCKCNLKQLGLALHNYHEANGCFPPAYVTDGKGRPMHSWRVLILPYIDQAALYAKYKFDEPWDGPHNIRLLDEIPPIYKCPSHCPSPRKVAGLPSRFGLLACSTLGTVSSSQQPRCTNYAAVLGKDCVFRGAQPVSIGDITDGTSNTVLVGEVTDSDILWTKPEDINVAKHPQMGDRMGFSSDHQTGAFFLMGDGSVRFISAATPQSTIDALYTRAAGDAVGDF